MSSVARRDELSGVGGWISLVESVIAMLGGVMSTARRDSSTETYRTLLGAAERRMAAIVAPLDDIERETLAIARRIGADRTIGEFVESLEHDCPAFDQATIARIAEIENTERDNHRAAVNLLEKAQGLVDALSDEELAFMVAARAATLRVVAALGRLAETSEARLSEVEDIHDLIRADAALATGETETHTDLRTRLGLS